MLSAARRIRRRLTNPKKTAGEYLDALRQTQLDIVASELEKTKGLL